MKANGSSIHGSLCKALPVPLSPSQGRRHMGHQGNVAHADDHTYSLADRHVGPCSHSIRRQQNVRRAGPRPARRTHGHAQRV